MPEDTVRRSLARMSPRGRELLRRYLIADQPDRDALASRLLAERTEGSIALADLIDTLTMYPDARRRVVRLLGEIEAVEDVRDGEHRASWWSANPEELPSSP